MMIYSNQISCLNHLDSKIWFIIFQCVNEEKMLVIADAVGGSSLSLNMKRSTCLMGFSGLSWWKDIGLRHGVETRGWAFHVSLIAVFCLCYGFGGSAFPLWYSCHNKMKTSTPAPRALIINILAMTTLLVVKRVECHVTWTQCTYNCVCVYWTSCKWGLIYRKSYMILSTPLYQMKVNLRVVK
jgi:hypothetical protein